MGKFSPMSIMRYMINTNYEFGILGTLVIFVNNGFGICFLF